MSVWQYLDGAIEIKRSGGGGPPGSTGQQTNRSTTWIRVLPDGPWRRCIETLARADAVARFCERTAEAMSQLTDE